MGAALPAAPKQDVERVEAGIAAFIHEFKALRRDLHQHPELSFQEAETARFVAGKLEAWGYEVTRNVGGHGVVARLTTGAGKKSIAIRADMDALPIEEQTGKPYASRAQGKMHACGHDGHTTMLLGAAEYLARTRRFSGTVNLIFQPAEEAGASSGAQAMIDDGLFERFPFDVIFGLHNHPGEDHTFVVLDGEVTFFDKNNKSTVLTKGQGIMIPGDWHYCFQNTGKGDLAMLRFGARKDKAKVVRVDSSGRTRGEDATEYEHVDGNPIAGKYWRLS